MEIAGSISEAEAKLAERVPTGLVLDIDLPDGSGLDWLEKLDQKRRAPITLVVTGLPGLEHEARADSLGARLVHKPCSPQILRNFVQRAVAAQRLCDCAAELTAKRAAQLGFNAREAKVLVLTVERVPRKSWADKIPVKWHRVHKLTSKMISRAREQGAAVAEVQDIADDILRELVVRPAGGELTGRRHARPKK